MATLQLPPGATGVDHWSGASYRADRQGKVVVPDSVAAEYRKNGVLRHYDVTLEGLPMGNTRPDDQTCCGRTLWDWETQCPKCGTEYDRAPAEAEAQKEEEPAGIS